MYHWAVYWGVQGEDEVFVDHYDTRTPWGARKRVRWLLEAAYGKAALDLLIIHSTELRRGRA
jgi:hypothetical protein